jgi:hypothetical protein
MYASGRELEGLQQGLLYRQNAESYSARAPIMVASGGERSAKLAQEWRRPCNLWKQQGDHRNIQEIGGREARLSEISVSGQTEEVAKIATILTSLPIRK